MPITIFSLINQSFGGTGQIRTQNIVLFAHHLFARAVDKYSIVFHRLRFGNYRKKRVKRPKTYCVVMFPGLRADSGVVIYSVHFGADKVNRRKNFEFDLATVHFLPGR